MWMLIWSLFVLLETFWILSCTASHVQREIIFVWEPQSWHGVYQPSAWGLGAFNPQHAALMLLFTVIHREPKDSCLVTVKCSVSVTEYWYKIHRTFLHHLASILKKSLAENKARFSIVSPLILESHHQCQDLSAVSKIHLCILGVD